jgi:starch phosphorylase
MYYERDKKGLPRRWLEKMKASMASTVWEFSTTRMLQEYVEQLYLPAAELPTSDPPGEPQPAAASANS